MSCEIVQRAVFTQTGGLVTSRAEPSEGIDGVEGFPVKGGVVQGSDGEEDDDDDDDGGGVRLPDSSEPALATTIVRTGRDGAHLSPHAHGLQVAKQREQVRQAARRGVAFGFPVGRLDGERQVEGRKRVDAVQGGRIVEASFAKGEWGVRWRE